jgi:dipeptidyl aminopeptidase/acylaminoacyl peptidase
VVSLIAWAAAATIAAAPPAPPTLSDLVEVVDISSLAVSPDGRWAAYRQEQSSLGRNAKLLSWWVADLQGTGPPRRLAEGGEGLWTDAGTLPAEPPLWSPDSRRFYMRALVDGAVQAWSVDLADGARRLTSEDGDVADLALVEGGARLGFTVGASRAAVRLAEQRQKDEGVLIDASIDPAQNLFDAAPVNGRPAAQRLTGRWFRRQGLLAEAPRIRKSVPATGGPVRTEDDPVALAGDGATRGKAAASPDGFGLARLADGRLDVTRPSGEVVACRVADCASVKALAWRPGADELVLTLGDSARRQRLAAWRPGRAQRPGPLRPLASTQGLIGGGAADTPCALTATTAVCVTAEPTTPPRLVSINLAGKPRTRLLAAPNQTLDGAAKPAARLFEWRAADGRAFAGWLMLPPGPPQRSPVFVTYYLCEGYLRGGFGDEFPLEAMAQAGIATLCINKAYQSEASHDPVADYRTGLSAVQAAVDRLAAEGLVDRARIGMGGFSFGSEVTTWTAMNSNLLAAASIASTQMEPAYYWLNGAAGRDNHAVLKRSWGLGPPEETPERWKLISPALNAARIRAPLLMQLPEQEYRLSFELFARLSNSTTPVDLYVFPGEPHMKTQPRHRLAVYQRNLDWFRFWLQGHVDPDPARAGQYARWSRMAERRAAAGAP